MAKIVFEMNQSLDGYVDHQKLMPDPVLFQHWIDRERELAANLYGRHLYEIMQYWQEDLPEWSAPAHAFAQVWRRQHKYVVSRTLQSVGPNATLIGDNVEAAVRDLKTRLDGEISVAGPELAHSLTELGLVDEYRLYLHPVVMGGGTPFFAGRRPPLRLVDSDRVSEDVIRLRYVPA